MKYFQRPYSLFSTLVDTIKAAKSSDSIERENQTPDQHTNRQQRPLPAPLVLFFHTPPPPKIFLEMFLLNMKYLFPVCYWALNEIATSHKWGVYSGSALGWRIYLHTGNWIWLDFNVNWCEWKRIANGEHKHFRCYSIWVAVLKKGERAEVKKRRWRGEEAVYRQLVILGLCLTVSLILKMEKKCVVRFNL